MTLRSYPLDTGGEGTAITQGNTGASVLSGCTGIYTAAAKVYGTYGVRLTIAAGATPALRFAGVAANNQYGLQFCTSGPQGAESGTVADVPMVTLRRSNGTEATIRWDKATNRIQIIEGTSGANILTYFTPASLATKYRYRIVANSSTGAWMWQVISTADQTTVVASGSGSTTFTNTSPFTDIQFGGSSDVQVVQDVDYVQLDDGATDFIPAPSNQLPTVTLTGIQNVAAGNPVVIDATATDPDGTIASYAWTVASYPSTSPPTVTGGGTSQIGFTAGSEGHLYVVSCTVTDNSGGQATASTEVRVPILTGGVTNLPEFVYPANAAYTATGGAASAAAALGDGNAGTSAETPDLSSTEAPFRQRLQPRAAPGNFTLTLSDVLLTSAATTTCKVRIGSGATQVREQLLNPTTSGQTVAVALTAAQVAAVADWGNLWYELVGVI